MKTSKMSNQAIVGILVVVIGVVLLLGTTGIADVGGVFRWIPSLFIIFGLWRLVAGGFKRLFGPVLIIVVATFVQLILLGIDIGSLWPVVLILIGLLMLFGGQRLWHRKDKENGNDQNEISLMSVMSSSRSRVTSKAFKGGEATAFMGGIEIDMRDAEIAERPATLEATVLMGSLEIVVPRDWIVDINTMTLMGGTEDKRRDGGYDNERPPHLIITGTVLMGGLEIKD